MVIPLEAKLLLAGHCCHWKKGRSATAFPKKDIHIKIDLKPNFLIAVNKIDIFDGKGQ